jgi:hypothetical protein
MLVERVEVVEAFVELFQHRRRIVWRKLLRILVAPVVVPHDGPGFYRKQRT